MGLEKLGIDKSTLLTVVTGAKIIGLRAASVTLTCCHKVRESLTEICDISIGLVADVWVYLGSSLSMSLLPGRTAGWWLRLSCQCTE